MQEFTELTREEIFRDSKDWYSKREKGGVSKNLIAFCQGRAGKKVLDFGCATGDYCLELQRLGFDCIGADINEEYIKIATAKGIEAVVVKGRLPFADDSFDTVIMFELLEHIQHPDEILSEAKRVASKNILLTVPNNTEFRILKKFNLTYEHMLEQDHMNFFTKESLSKLLSRNFKEYNVQEKEPIYFQGLLPVWLRKPISLGIRLKLIKPLVYFRLYAECLV